MMEAGNRLSLQGFSHEPVLIRPDQKFWERAAFLKHFIEPTRRLAFESEIAETEYGKISLWYGFSIASVLRQFIRNPGLMEKYGLFEVTGGSADNPHEKIDLIGGNIIRQILRKIEKPVSYYVEENHRWHSLNTRNR